MAKKALNWSDLTLIKELGSGQAGSVWLAELRNPFADLPAGTSVAVKRYKGWVMEQDGQLERMFRELEIGRKIRHANLLQTLTVVFEESVGPALIMRYYQGKTLQHVLEEYRASGSPMSLDKVLNILSALADVLALLHSNSIVHRDVKPANIMITDNGPILMDLGVIQTDLFPEQTTTGAFLGTIRYGAPEYLFGELASPLADVYSFGAIAYELFFGDAFLGSEQHWARQLVRKRSWPQGPSQQDYQALAARIGLHYAELVKFVCNRTLVPVERRTLDLPEFAAAVTSGIVHQAFIVDGGKLMPGMGYWPSLPGVECESNQCTPEDIANFIQHMLSASELQYMLNLLSKTYWQGYVVEDLSDARLLRLESLHILERSDIGGFTVHFFHSGVIAAYRYGLLRPTSVEEIPS